MGVISNVVIGGVLFCFVMSAQQFVWSLLPQECTTPPCITPLFDASQLVDIYVAVSSADGRRSKQAPLWNITGVSADQAFNVTIPVPLPSDVRQNGSLTAHVTVVRTGKSPVLSAHSRHVDSRGEAWRQRELPVAPYSDILTASAPLTRYMRPIRQNRTRLLGNSPTEQQLPPGTTKLELPLNYTVSIDPVAAMGWAAMGFTLLGFRKPTMITAAARLLVVAVSPYLYSLHQMDTRYAQEQTSALAARMLQVLTDCVREQSY